MAELLQEWWFWVSGSLVLGILEAIIPGYLFLGFAIGALALGILVAIGFAPAGAAAIIAVFAVLSLLAYIGLRMAFKLDRGQVKIWDRDINDN